jgi:hypothetical protein
MGESAWVGYFVAFLLSLITALLALLAWLSRQVWTEQKETNKGFRETLERIWSHLATKVSDSTCQERFNNTKCNLGDLETDFRKHSHTELPDTARLVIKE